MTSSSNTLSTLRIAFAVVSTPSRRPIACSNALLDTARVIIPDPQCLMHTAIQVGIRLMRQETR